MRGYLAFVIDLGVDLRGLLRHIRILVLLLPLAVPGTPARAEQAAASHDWSEIGRAHV